MIDMASWVEQLKSKLDLKGRVIHFGQHPDTAQLFINYYNLPESLVRANLGGGAEAENNRVMLTVLFPSKGSWYEKPVKEGTLRVKLSVGTAISLYIFTAKTPQSTNYNLRGKTCPPEKMIDYVASYLNRIAAEIDPNYTHSNLTV